MTQAWADFDNDGAMDLALSSRNHYVIRNRLAAGQAAGSLQVMVLDEDGVHTRAGTEVRLYAAGTRQLIGTRLIETGSGYNAQSVLPVHFGLPRQQEVDGELTLMAKDGRKTALLRNVDPKDHVGSHLVVKVDAEGRIAQDLIDADAVERQWRRVIATFEEGDVDAFMALTTQDVVLMPPGEKTLSSGEAVRSLMADFFGTYAIELQSISLEEIVVAGDWAFVRDTYVSNLTPRSGGETVRARGKNVWILQRQADGSWKVARNMWNSSDPPTQ